MPGELRVFPNAARVAQALADLFIECAADALAQRGRFFVSLAGGTTPKAAYALLAQAPLRAAIDWSAVELFFGDERCVPPSDDESNYKMVMETFARAAGVPESNVHRMRGEDDPASAAAAYRTELIRALGQEPRLDLTMLGMGPDGHTASLFPGADPLIGNDDLVRAVYSQAHSQWRITMTPRVLNAARTIVFAVDGAAKAEALAEVRYGPRNPTKYPSQIIAPVDGRLIWLTDAAAATPPKNETL
ncbi:MAG: 6-phosphogluconolactonase [Candidatus Baltobacteraceae bacterium]